MKLVSKIVLVVILDNKLFILRNRDSLKWHLPSVKKGNWLSEERAVKGRIQKEIGVPVNIKSRLGDFYPKAKLKKDVSHISVFVAELMGPIFIRNKEIVEWRYVSEIECKDINFDDAIMIDIIKKLAKNRLLIWPNY